MTASVPVEEKEEEGLWKTAEGAEVDSVPLEVRTVWATQLGAAPTAPLLFSPWSVAPAEGVDVQFQTQTPVVEAVAVAVVPS